MASVTQSLYNQSARQIRVFLCVAAGLFIICIPPALIMLIVRPASSTNLAQGCFLALAIPLPLLAAALLIPLMMIPRARLARRILGEFSEGNALAHWKYAEDAWQAKVEAERRRWRKIAWVAATIVFAVGIFITAMSTLSQFETPHGKLIDVLIGSGINIAISSLLLISLRIFSTRRCKRLMQCGEAYIGHHGAYCGGDFMFWGKGTQSLHSARVTSDDPPQIELVISLSRAASRVASAIDTLNLVTLSFTNTSGYSARQLIPVPPGGEAVARALVEQLTQEAQTRSPGKKGAPVRPQISPAIPQTPKTPDIHRPQPTADMVRHIARRWWLITAVMAATGIALFIWAVAVSLNAPPNSRVGDTQLMWGFCLFVLSIIPLIVAVAKTFKVKRMQRHAKNTSPVGHGA